MAKNDDTSPEPVVASDIVADAKAWLADFGGERLQTHSGNCHRWHPTCLVGKLTREIERLRLLVPPIAGTVNANTGMDFVPWSVAASTSHFSTTVLPKGFEPVRLDGWIQTSQRLPPDGENVLWYSPDDEFCKYLLGEKEGNGINWGGDLNNTLTAYTHWRHLPGPPSSSVK